MAQPWTLPPLRREGSGLIIEPGRILVTLNAAACSGAVPQGICRHSAQVRLVQALRHMPPHGPAGHFAAPIRSADVVQEIGVEQAKANGDPDSSDGPKPDDDVDLAPANHLEMVVQRRHTKDPLAGGLE
jgi:hypothetical protein